MFIKLSTLSKINFHSRVLKKLLKSMNAYKKIYIKICDAKKLDHITKDFVMKRFQKSQFFTKGTLITFKNLQIM